jgi:hypothetical protein
MKRSILIIAGLIAMSVSGAAAADDPIQGITAARGDGSPVGGAKFIVLDVDTGDYSSDFNSLTPGEVSGVMEDDGSNVYLHKTDGKTGMKSFSDHVFNRAVDFQVVAAGVTDGQGKASFTIQHGSWDARVGDGERPDLMVILYQTEGGISRIVGESAVASDASGPLSLPLTAWNLSALPQVQAQSPAVAAYAAGITKLDFVGLDAAVLALLRGPQIGSSWHTGLQTVQARVDTISTILKKKYPGQDAATALLAETLFARFASYVAMLQRLADLWKKGALEPSDYPGSLACWRLQQMLLYKLQFCQGSGTKPVQCSSRPEQNVTAEHLVTASGLTVDKAVTQNPPTPAMGGLDLDDD